MAAAALVVLVLLVLSGCARRPAPDPAAPAVDLPREPIPLLSGDSVRIATHVVSFDGHRIPITLYRPVEADAKRPVPLLLHSHGWSGSRQTTDNVFRDFHRAGFGVLSIDMRGHGEARTTSAARVHHMEFEIKDVREVITWIAKHDWVLQDAVDDPRIGALGGSYGGGYQLLTAATDPRLDAIAPEITWNDLLGSLAPNGAVRSAWVDILYASGNLNARLDPSIHQAFMIAQSFNRIPDGSLPGEPDLEAQFERSSPRAYSAIRIPTFLIQGVNDTLFNLNEAVANYAAVRSAGGDARLVTHLGGHILNTRGTIPVPAPQPVGLQSPTSGSPCGVTRQMTIAWYQVQLLGHRLDLGPRVCLALEDHTFVSGDEFPLPGTEMREHRLEGSVQLSQPVSRVASSLEVLTVGDQPVVLAGIPVLEGKLTTSGDAIVYYSLSAVRGTMVRTLNAQVTPQRAMSSQDFILELAGVGARLQPGETLFLTVAATNDQFMHNQGRTPAQVGVTDLRLRLPVLASA